MDVILYSKINLSLNSVFHDHSDISKRLASIIYKESLYIENKRVRWITDKANADC